MRQAAALSGAAAFCLPRCLPVQSGDASDLEGEDGAGSVACDANADAAPR